METAYVQSALCKELEKERRRTGGPLSGAQVLRCVRKAEKKEPHIRGEKTTRQLLDFARGRRE